MSARSTQTPRLISVYLIRLEGKGDPRKHVRAIRWLLKLALRACGLRCIEARED